MYSRYFKKPILAIYGIASPPDSVTRFLNPTKHEKYKICSKNHKKHAIQKLNKIPVFCNYI